MAFDQEIPVSPESWLRRRVPDEPVLFFDPQALRAMAGRFLRGFPGLVTYAVKANPDRAILETLASCGIGAFDVASPREMALVRAACPGAVLHYHNPIRSVAEIAAGRRFRVQSWSIDRATELDKLGDIAGQEIAVRLKLPVAGAAYDFGDKFGANPAESAALLRRVAARGARPSLTFHPGTQCTAPEAWRRYIHAAARVAAQAGVALHRLNVGGGFAADRDGTPADPEAIFGAISEAVQAGFAVPPPLVCEPGRGLVAEAVTLALRVKATSGDAVFLNDGVYGALGEWRDLPPGGRIVALGPQGRRTGTPVPRTVFGPTCDSLDRLPVPLPLPGDLAEGDHLLIPAMGAYAGSLCTGFNGYGARHVVTLCDAEGRACTGHRRAAD